MGGRLSRAIRRSCFGDCGADEALDRGEKAGEHFVACVAYPCILYYKEKAKLLIVMLIHVDDSMCQTVMADLWFIWIMEH